MTNSRRTTLKTLALSTCAALALATAAQAQDTARFDIAGGDLKTALQTFSGQTSQEILFSSDLVAGRRTKGVSAATDPQTALLALLDGTGLSFTQTPTGTLLVVRADAPQSGSAAGAGAEVEALIVTAQKREEDIQDVPIAISAFTQEALDAQKIEGGFDLLKAIPNVTFSKNNFTSYNFSIRGIGTKAVSATTDPGVAVSFNNVALIQNRLFEQEYFDVERVEVLRGPQGTLYGRNATAGVINLITAKPDMDEFKGWVKGEVGNYDTKRISAMVNVPLVEDKLAIRLAGAMTDRQGYDYNSITENAINGRDLWSARLTVGFNPTERIRTELIWERFNEDDNRSRTGKQLCKKDPGKTTVGNTDVTQVPTGGNDDYVNRFFNSVVHPALLSQGCLPVNLYDNAAFDTPNGMTLPFVLFMMSYSGLYGFGHYTPEGVPITLVNYGDPYGGLKQDRDLRVIASIKDPRYRAQADLVEFNFSWDLADQLTLTSQTAYNKDEVYSSQDYNRFNTFPIFTDTAALPPHPWSNLAPGGKFCDPQLGCSDTLVGYDIASAKGSQFTEELRLQSDLDGPLNFSAGANYTRFKTLVDYYVFYNMITAVALMQPFNKPADQQIDLTVCGVSGFLGNGPQVEAGAPTAWCPYIDPNPLESINGEGHNYFRSKNPYKLQSAAAFGEIYWNINEVLKLTAGLRYTGDRKTFIPVPSQLLLSGSLVGAGVVSRGNPERPPIKQQWREWTGRLGVDWKPELPFTDQSMVYAFYSRGYKGGGANPPTPGFATAQELQAILRRDGFSESDIELFTDMGAIPSLKLTGVEYGPTFRPEFVNAFEMGSKNTLLGGGLVLNMGAFFYDYTDYQISQIRDRSAVNENFDATAWGLEFETVFSPSRDLRIIANLGYLDTRIADGMKSIDIMNRTQGNPNYVVAKPWVQLPSNCVVPVHVVEAYFQSNASNGSGNPYRLCGGVRGVVNFAGQGVIDPNPEFGGGLLLYDHNNYPELNGGAGLHADLGGNELPNSPHWTTNLAVQYGMDFAEGWRATIRADAYWQSQSWARVYNLDPYDKLHGWYNANLSLWVENDDGLKIELYAKNILDKTPITDAFLNSDDSALTTNVFVLDPRLIGLSIRKEF